MKSVCIRAYVELCFYWWWCEQKQYEMSCTTAAVFTICRGHYTCYTVHWIYGLCGNGRKEAFRAWKNVSESTADAIFVVQNLQWNEINITGRMHSMIIISGIVVISNRQDKILPNTGGSWGGGGQMPPPPHAQGHALQKPKMVHRNGRSSVWFLRALSELSFY